MVVLYCCNVIIERIESKKEYTYKYNLHCVQSETSIYKMVSKNQFRSLTPFTRTFCQDYILFTTQRFLPITHEEIFSRYYMRSFVCSKLKLSTTVFCLECIWNVDSGSRNKHIPWRIELCTLYKRSKRCIHRIVPVTRHCILSSFQ